MTGFYWIPSSDLKAGFALVVLCPKISASCLLKADRATASR